MWSRIVRGAFFISTKYNSQVTTVENMMIAHLNQPASDQKFRELFTSLNQVISSDPKQIQQFLQNDALFDHIINSIPQKELDYSPETILIFGKFFRNAHELNYTLPIKDLQEFFQKKVSNMIPSMEEDYIADIFYLSAFLQWDCSQIILKKIVQQSKNISPLVFEGILLSKSLYDPNLFTILCEKLTINLPNKSDELTKYLSLLIQISEKFKLEKPPIISIILQKISSDFQSFDIVKIVKFFHHLPKEFIQICNLLHLYRYIKVNNIFYPFIKLYQYKNQLFQLIYLKKISNQLRNYSDKLIIHVSFNYFVFFKKVGSINLNDSDIIKLLQLAIELKFNLTNFSFLQNSTEILLIAKMLLQLNNAKEAIFLLLKKFDKIPIEKKSEAILLLYKQNSIFKDELDRIKDPAPVILEIIDQVQFKEKDNFLLQWILNNFHQVYPHYSNEQKVKLIICLINYLPKSFQINLNGDMLYLMIQNKKFNENLIVFIVNGIKTFDKKDQSDFFLQLATSNALVEYCKNRGLPGIFRHLSRQIELIQRIDLSPQQILNAYNTIGQKANKLLISFLQQNLETCNLELAYQACQHDILIETIEQNICANFLHNSIKQQPQSIEVVKIRLYLYNRRSAHQIKEYSDDVFREQQIEFLKQQPFSLQGALILFEENEQVDFTQFSKLSNHQLLEYCEKFLSINKQLFDKSGGFKYFLDQYLSQLKAENPVQQSLKFLQLVCEMHVKDVEIYKKLLSHIKENTLQLRHQIVEIIETIQMLKFYDEELINSIKQKIYKFKDFDFLNCVVSLMKLGHYDQQFFKKEFNFPEKITKFKDVDLKVELLWTIILYWNKFEQMMISQKNFNLLLQGYSDLGSIYSKNSKSQFLNRMFMDIFNFFELIEESKIKSISNNYISFLRNFFGTINIKHQLNSDENQKSKRNSKKFHFQSESQQTKPRNLFNIIRKEYQIRTQLLFRLLICRYIPQINKYNHQFPKFVLCEFLISIYDCFQFQQDHLSGFGQMNQIILNLIRSKYKIDNIININQTNWNQMNLNEKIELIINS